MSILIYTESEGGKLKKTAFEIASYAKALAGQTGTTVTAVAVNADNTAELGKYGVDKVLKVSDEKLKGFNARAYADVIKQAAAQENAGIVIISSSANDKYLAPVLAINLEAGYAPNVVALPESTDPFRIKRTAFTNKAFNITEIRTDVNLSGFPKTPSVSKRQTEPPPKRPLPLH